MALIKRGLGARHHDAHERRPVERDCGCSSLQLRTAALLQRLRAQQSGQKVISAGWPELPPDGEGWQADLNRVQLTGCLAREPLLYDVADHHVARLQLRSERRWRTAPLAVVRSHTAFQLTAWEDLADYCGRHLHAGDRIFVEGQLRPISGRVVEGLCVNYEIVLERIMLLARPPAARHRNDA